jgi:hypothetical protein
MGIDAWLVPVMTMNRESQAARGVAPRGGSGGGHHHHYYPAVQLHSDHVFPRLRRPFLPPRSRLSSRFFQVLVNDEPKPRLYLAFRPCLESHPTNSELVLLHRQELVCVFKYLGKFCSHSIPGSYAT